LRWRWLLEPCVARAFGDVRRGRAGFMTTLLVPGRVGELVRPALLSAREDLPLGPCLGKRRGRSASRWSAIVALFALGSQRAHFVAGSAAFGRADPDDRGDRSGVIALAWVVLVVLIGSGRPPRPLALAPMVPDSMASAAPLGALPRGRGAALAAPVDSDPRLQPWPSGRINGVATWIGIRAAGAPIGFADTLVMMPLLALGVSLPTPGGVGGYHALMQSP